MSRQTRDRLRRAETLAIRAARRRPLSVDMEYLPGGPVSPLWLYLYRRAASLVDALEMYRLELGSKVPEGNLLVRNLIRTLGRGGNDYAAMRRVLDEERGKLIQTTGDENEDQGLLADLLWLDSPEAERSKVVLDCQNLLGLFSDPMNFFTSASAPGHLSPAWYPSSEELRANDGARRMAAARVGHTLWLYGVSAVLNPDVRRVLTDLGSHPEDFAAVIDHADARETAVRRGRKRGTPDKVTPARSLEAVKVARLYYAVRDTLLRRVLREHADEVREIIASSPAKKLFGRGRGVHEGDWDPILAEETAFKEVGNAFPKKSRKILKDLLRRRGRPWPEAVARRQV